MRLRQRAREWVRRVYRGLDVAIARRFFSYGADELKRALRRLGVAPGDTILVHSAFTYRNGFRGGPQGVIAALTDAVGADGNVMMVSLPYTGASSEYLRDNPVFDVLRTPSRMGIVSEVFRRRKDVRRSLHPTHPVLAWGARADWLVEGHEKSAYGCGPGSPFDKLRQLGGKSLFFDVRFTTFTFFHHIEHVLQQHLPFPLYATDPVMARVRDCQGRERFVEAYVFSARAVRSRRPQLLGKELERRGLLRKGRVGRTSLLLVRVEDAARVAQEMIMRGQPFYEV